MRCVRAAASALAYTWRCCVCTTALVRARYVPQPLSLTLICIPTRAYTTNDVSLATHLYIHAHTHTHIHTIVWQPNAQPVFSNASGEVAFSLRALQAATVVRLREMLDEMDAAGGKCNEHGAGGVAAREGGGDAAAEATTTTPTTAAAALAQ